jgi:hypothetical protein
MHFQLEDLAQFRMEFVLRKKKFLSSIFIYLFIFYCVS